TDNVPGLPPFTYVTRIIASHAAAGTVYAAFDGHRSDDFEAYVYRSDDYGASWERITGGLPTSSVNALEQHPRNANLWFVGNELGVWVSVNGGDAWVEMESGLPTVPVDDIDIHPRDNDLVIGTHGRGIWIMDDITPLEELAPDAALGDVRLFGVRDAVSYNPYSPQEWPAGVWQADNADYGAAIRFHIGEATAAAADSFTVRIEDASGALMRRIRRTVEPGMHEVQWNLALQLEGPDGEMMDPGPRVMPGTYRAALQVDGMAATAMSEFEVLLDPRADITQSQLMARHAAILDSYRLSGSANQAEDALDEAEEHLDAALERARNADDDAVVEQVEAALERRDELEEALDDASEGAGAWFSIQSIHMPPTQSQLDAIERSWDALPDVIGEINAWLSGELSAALSAAASVSPPAPDALGPIPLPTRGGG
ncbi:MAG: hypothetical protein RLN75_04250, partial [Longimicrobiales bacterium]